MKKYIKPLMFVLLATVLILFYLMAFEVTKNNLQEKLSQKFDEAVEVIDIVDEDSLYVYFKTANQLGYAYFEKGLVNYHLTRMQVSDIESKLSYDVYGNNLILFGDFEAIKTIEIFTTKGKVLVDTGFRDVVHIESDLTQVSMTGFMIDYINRSTDYIGEPYEITYEINSNKAYFYQPVYIIYVLMIVIVLIFFLLISLFRKEDTLLMKIFNQKSKELSSDPNDYSMTDTFLDR
ncbi:MAG: hypothetical protein JXR88_03745 [Clostridia bacterium]|nr:hypothetical protein [Clostridia bacterium]